MTPSTPGEIFAHVIDAAAKRVEHLGFRRRGNALRRVLDGIAAIVEFQKSSKNTPERISFTINLAVVSSLLLEEDHLPLERAGSIHGQLRERIGMLLPDRPDKWWSIDNATEEDVLASEIAELIADKAVPYLERFLSMDALAALWASGKSPGLTATQRMNYLAMARAMNARSV